MGKLVGEDFQWLADINNIEDKFNAIGFPRVFPIEQDVKKLQELAEKYIDHILSTDRKFTVSTSELGIF